MCARRLRRNGRERMAMYTHVCISCLLTGILEGTCCYVIVDAWKLLVPLMSITTGIKTLCDTCKAIAFKMFICCGEPAHFFFRSQERWPISSNHKHDFATDTAAKGKRRVILRAEAMKYYDVACLVDHTVWLLC